MNELEEYIAIARPQNLIHIEELYKEFLKSPEEHTMPFMMWVELELQNKVRRVLN